jgi:hypothetical protein
MNVVSSQRPTTIQRFRCPSSSGDAAQQPDIYKITTVSQNLGHRTAEGYQMTVGFASTDRRQRDPGVRILYVGVDDLRIVYLYQHDVTRTRPACLHDPEEKPTWNISPVARQTYGELGLTRDMVILIGNLPAQVFQIIDIVAYIPCSTKRFAAIFQVQCPNCRFSYRMLSLAQVLELPDDCANARRR